MIDGLGFRLGAVSCVDDPRLSSSRLLTGPALHTNRYRTRFASALGRGSGITLLAVADRIAGFGTAGSVSPSVW